MSLRLVKRPGRCVCGLKVAYHFDADNRKQNCEEAARRHPRAHKRGGFRAALFSSGATIFTGLRPTHGVVIGMIGGTK